MNAVVGIDGSKQGHWAIEWLAMLPFRKAPTVVGVHGVDLQSEPAPLLTHPSLSGSEPDIGEAIRLIEYRAKQVVGEAQQRMKALGLKGSVRVERRAIAKALLKHAGRSNGFVVVGSRGLNVLDQVTMGSVSAAVTLHAPCPVLVVKEPPRPIRRILLATDGSPSSDKARDFIVKRFRMKPDAQMGILLVHVMPFLRYLAVKEAGEQLLAREAAKLEKAGYHVRQFPRVGPAADEIMKVVSREQPDLIVTGAKGRSAVARFLQGSVSMKIVQRSDCSVLVVR